MKKRVLKLAFVIGLTIAFVSCEELELGLTGNSVQSVDSAKGVIEENSDTELQVVKVFENVNNFGIIEEGKKSARLDDFEPVYTLSGKVLTIDLAGVDKSQGKIIATFNKVPIPFYQVGLSAKITFQNYKFDGVGLAGEMNLIITEYDGTNVKFEINIPNYITVTDGISYQWKCSQTVLWSEGYNTLTIPSDDSFVLNGTSSQIKDTVQNDMILTDIVMPSDCEFITDGEIEVTAYVGTENQFVVTTNFGVDELGEDKGECDAWIMMNSEGLVENLKIKITSL